MTRTTLLDDRAIVRIAGEEAEDFLQALVTCNVADLADGAMTFGALLTPQGKILFDFFCLRDGRDFVLDVAASMRDDLVRRLQFYRLRRPVTIEPDDALTVTAVWDNASNGEGCPDPRHKGMGQRVIGARSAGTAAMSDYQAHRIDFAMPRGGDDFSYGDAFPHDAMMDRFETAGAGVDFSKGCYVGQEVVSRMQHRGTARKRIVKLTPDQPLSEPGASILAGNRMAGRLGSVSASNGLAMVRLDRVKAALDAGEAITADGVAVIVTLPPWAGLDWPQQ